MPEKVQEEGHDAQRVADQSKGLEGEGEHHAVVDKLSVDEPEKRAQVTLREVLELLFAVLTDLADGRGSQPCNRGGWTAILRDTNWRIHRAFHPFRNL